LGGENALPILPSELPSASFDGRWSLRKGRPSIRSSMSKRASAARRTMTGSTLAASVLTITWKKNVISNPER
jgi:hypothetical protein